MHPLVREAVYQELSAGQRELMHARAATVLRDAGAQPDQVASHLLSMARRSRSGSSTCWWRRLRRPCDAAAPDSAVAYLTRALEEPPTPERRGQILLDLGISGTNTYAPLALEHLGEAYELLEDPRKRAIAAWLLSRTLIFAGSPDAAAAFAQRALAELPPELHDERNALEAVELISVYFGADAEDALERSRHRRQEPFGDGPGAKMLQATVAFGVDDRCGRRRRRHPSWP